LVGGKIVLLKVGMEREIEPFKDEKGKVLDLPDYLKEIKAPAKAAKKPKEGAKAPPTVGEVSVKKAAEKVEADKKTAKAKLEDL